MLLHRTGSTTSLSMLSVYQHSFVCQYEPEYSNGRLTRLSVNPISASSGNMPPITCFIRPRPYSGTVLIGSGLYFVRGVESRLSG